MGHIEKVLTRFAFDVEAMKEFAAQLKNIRLGFPEKQEDPMKIIDGPHMYNDDCGCMSCADARARDRHGHPIEDGKGDQIFLESVRREVKSLRAQNDGWQTIEVNLLFLERLLELAENDGLNPEAAYWRKEYQDVLKHRDGLLDKRDAEIRELRAELTDRAIIPRGEAKPVDMTITLKPEEKGSRSGGEVSLVEYTYECDTMERRFSYTCSCGYKMNGRIPPNLDEYNVPCVYCGSHKRVWE